MTGRRSLVASLRVSQAGSVRISAEWLPGPLAPAARIVAGLERPGLRVWADSDSEDRDSSHRR